MDAAFFAAEFLFHVLGEHGGKFDFFAVQILRRYLRQLVELAFYGVVDAWVRIAEVNGRIPHLQIEEGRAGGIIHVGAFAAVKDFWFFEVMNRIAK